MFVVCEASEAELEGGWVFDEEELDVGAVNLEDFPTTKGGFDTVEILDEFPCWNFWHNLVAECECASGIVGVVDTLQGEVAAELLAIDVISGDLAFEFLEYNGSFLIGLLLALCIEEIVVIWEAFEKWCAEAIINNLFACELSDAAVFAVEDCALFGASRELFE